MNKQILGASALASFNFKAGERRFYLNSNYAESSNDFAEAKRSQAHQQSDFLK